ncbi:hypothetical protein ACP70R_024673 [Stipagrostis hirtigluma subsp. patula]
MGVPNAIARPRAHRPRRPSLVHSSRPGKPRRRRRHAIHREHDRRRQVAGLGREIGRPVRRHRVKCDDAGRVTSIGASRGGLAGKLLGSDLSKLSSLADLDLSFNSLADDLPLLPTPLRHHRTLDLHSNRFLDIPEGFFAGFPALETIALDDNPMVDPKLRLDVLTCSGLRSLSAKNISLLGDFPDYFGNTVAFPALESLSLARNEIMGTISPTFGKNSKIKYLDVSGQIDGTLTGFIDQFDHPGHGEPRGSPAGSQ